MAKVLLVVLVAIAAYWILRLYVRGPGSGSGASGQPDPADRAEDMVRCAECGVHLPLSESTAADGRHYCSEEHRRLHAD